MKKVLAIFVLVALIGGCGTTGYYYRVNPTEEVFPDEAYVLLAVVGEYDLNVVRGKNKDGKGYSLVVYPKIQEEPLSEVLALKFKAGDSLAIESIQFEAAEGSNVVKQKYAYLSVDNPKLMEFPESKIYYYGMVMTNENQAVLVHENKEKVMQVARKKFPTLFARYPVAD